MSPTNIFGIVESYMDTTVRQGLTSVSYLLDCWRFVESVRQGPIKLYS